MPATRHLRSSPSNAFAQGYIAGASRRGVAPGEMVEAGAKAIARAWEGPRGWEDMAEAERDILRRDARAALLAALDIRERRE